MVAGGKKKSLMSKKKSIYFILSVQREFTLKKKKKTCIGDLWIQYRQELDRPAETGENSVWVHVEWRRIEYLNE